MIANFNTQGAKKRVNSKEITAEQPIAALKTSSCVLRLRKVDTDATSNVIRESTSILAYLSLLIDGDACVPSATKTYFRLSRLKELLWRDERFIDWC